MTQPLPALRSDLKFTPHRQHARVWYAVEDPTTGRYLRLGRYEYLAAIQLDGHRDATAIIAAARAIDESLSLTEKELGQLLGWLSRANLLAGMQPQNSFQGAAAPLSSKCVWDPFAARFPLIKGIHVEKLARALQFLASPQSSIVAVLLVLVAIFALVSNWQEFFKYTEKLFVAEGRLWWIVAWLLLKVVHELGHAVTALKAGSQIRSAGISLIFLAPVPFIDVSDLWSISNRWRRIFCSLGGMLFEIVVAAVAVLIAFATDNDALRYFACAIAITGTFTTIAFNANPLMRFDGYFILADLLQKSNLWGDGQTATRELLRRILHPYSQSTVRLNWSITLYGVACTIYRFGMLLGLGITALIVWQEYGFVLIAWGCCAWFVLPWWKVRQARRIAELRTSSPSSIKSSLGWVSPTLAIIAVSAICFLPLPIQPSVPGIVTPREPTILRIETDGYLAKVYVDEQDTVEIGDLIARFENPSLSHMLECKRVEVACSTESISAMRARGELAEFQAEQAKLASLHEQLAQLEKRVDHLEVRAPVAGAVVSSDLARQLGKYFTAGTGLAWIAKPSEFDVRLSASQQEHTALRNWAGTEIRITNSNQKTAFGFIDKLDWRGSDLLEEPALAAIYGGPITVETGSSMSEGGIKLPEPRFNVLLRVESASAANLVAGQLAWAHLPNSSMRMVDLLSHWVNKKWQAAKQTNGNG